MQDFNSQKWIRVINEKYRSMQDNKALQLILYQKVQNPLVVNGYLKLIRMKMIIWISIKNFTK